MNWGLYKDAKVLREKEGFMVVQGRSGEIWRFWRFRGDGKSIR